MSSEVCFPQPSTGNAKKTVFPIFQKATISGNSSESRSATVVPEGPIASPSRLIQIVPVKPNTPPSRFAIHPIGLFRKNWNRVLLVAMYFNVVAVPFQIAFDPDILETPLFADVLNVVNWLIDVLFIVDILLNFLTGFYNTQTFTLTKDESDLVLHIPTIARRYLRTWFFADLLSVGIPFSLGSETGLVDKTLSLLKVLRVVRFARLRSSKSKKIRHIRRRNFLGSPQFKNIVELLALFILMAHYAGCYFYFIGRVQVAEAGGSWLMQHDASMVGGHLRSKYVTTFYFGITTLTTVGYGDITPVNNTERTFVSVLLFVGAVMYATIFGNVTLLLQNRNGAQARYSVMVERIEEFVSTYGLSPATASSMLEYVDYMWDRNSGIDLHGVLQLYPTSMRADILMSIHQNLIRKVPFFRDCCDGFIREIVCALRCEVYVVGSFVFHEGDRARCMYFVRTGAVEVLSGSPAAARPAVLSTMGAGSFLGEIGLLLSAPRTASVRSVARSELYSLFKEDVKDALKGFPEYESRLREVAIARLQRDVNLERHRSINQLKMLESFQRYADAAGGGAEIVPGSGLQSPCTAAVTGSSAEGGEAKPTTPATTASARARLVRRISASHFDCPPTAATARALSAGSVGQPLIRTRLPGTRTVSCVTPEMKSSPPGNNGSPVQGAAGVGQKHGDLAVQEVESRSRRASYPGGRPLPRQTSSGSPVHTFNPEADITVLSPAQKPQVASSGTVADSNPIPPPKIALPTNASDSDDDSESSDSLSRQRAATRPKAGGAVFYAPQHRRHNSSTVSQVSWSDRRRTTSNISSTPSSQSTVPTTALLRSHAELEGRMVLVEQKQEEMLVLLRRLCARSQPLPPSSEPSVSEPSVSEK